MRNAMAEYEEWAGTMERREADATLDAMSDLVGFPRQQMLAALAYGVAPVMTDVAMSVGARDV
jgi:hypothetical protein